MSRSFFKFVPECLRYWCCTGTQMTRLSSCTSWTSSEWISYSRESQFGNLYFSSTSNTLIQISSQIFSCGPPRDSSIEYYHSTQKLMLIKVCYENMASKMIGKNAFSTFSEIWQYRIEPLVYNGWRSAYFSTDIIAKSHVLKSENEFSGLTY